MVEDAQWADGESLAWFDHLLTRAEGSSGDGAKPNLVSPSAALRPDPSDGERLGVPTSGAHERRKGSPVLVMVAARPAFWREGPQRFAGKNHVRLDLRPLAKKNVHAIARAILGEKEHRHRRRRSLRRPSPIRPVDRRSSPKSSLASWCARIRAATRVAYRPPSKPPFKCTSTASKNRLASSRACAQRARHPRLEYRARRVRIGRRRRAHARARGRRNSWWNKTTTPISRGAGVYLQARPNARSSVRLAGRRRAQDRCTKKPGSSSLPDRRRRRHCGPPPRAGRRLGSISCRLHGSRSPPCAGHQRALGKR